MKKYYFSILLAVFLFLSVPVHSAELAGVEIHGFVSQGFLLSGDNNYFSAKTSDGSFQFNELGINFSKDLTDELRMGVQIFSRDFGRADNNTVVIDWAYGDYHWQDWLGIRAGLMKMPHGLYSENRDQDMVRTSVLLPQSVYPELTRDYYSRMWGVQLYGNIPLHAAGILSYKLMAGTYNPDEDTSGLALLVEASGFYEIERFNHDKGEQYSGSLVWETPLEGLRVGATGWYMKNIGSDFSMPYGFGPAIPPGTEASLELDRWATVYSIEYTWENFRIVGEYMLQNTDNRWSDTLPGLSDWEQDTEGYYIGASYRFTDWFELGSYYSEYFPDKDDKDGDQYTAFGGDDFQAWHKDFALTTRFDINEYWLVKLEGHYMDGVAEAALGTDNSDGFKQHDYLFAAKVTFNF